MRHIAAIAIRKSVAVRRKAENANAIAGNMKPSTRSYLASRRPNNCFITGTFQKTVCIFDEDRYRQLSGIPYKIRSGKD